MLLVAVLRLVLWACLPASLKHPLDIDFWIWLVDYKTGRCRGVTDLQIQKFHKQCQCLFTLSPPSDSPLSDLSVGCQRWRPDPIIPQNLNYPALVSSGRGGSVQKSRKTLGPGHPPSAFHKIIAPAATKETSN